MSSRPRRSAAQKASVAITDMADRDNMSSSRSRRAGDGVASVSRGPQGGNDHTYLTVKVPSSKLRQATSSRQGSSIAVNSDSAPKRSTRGGKKSYVVESDSDDDEEEGEDEIQVGAPAVADDDDDDNDDEEMDDADDDDAEGEGLEDEMDVDADGEDDEDAEGDEDDMAPPPAPVIRVSKSSQKSPESKKTKKATPQKATVQFSAPNDSDDDELSELESDEELEIEGEDDAEVDEEDEDMDAEGDEVEVEVEVDDDQEAGARPERDAGAAPGRESRNSDDELSEGGTPDFSRMTVRQRARFEEVDSSHYQALSNEVQAKKHFTAEEKAMRRAEMARRRRNLSEKRNEEVKQETINKLLKKQAGKTNRKNLQAIGEEEQDADGFRRPNPVFIRWISSREGERIAVPGEILAHPAGRLLAGAARPGGAGPAGLAAPKKMVEEVS